MTPEVEKTLELEDIIDLLKDTSDQTLCIFVHGALLMSLEVINERLASLEGRAITRADVSSLRGRISGIESEIRRLLKLHHNHWHKPGEPTCRKRPYAEVDCEASPPRDTGG